MSIYNADIFKNVEKATVRLPKGGQGVLVSGDLILTAAHCIRFSLEGEMVFDTHFIEEIETKSGPIKACAWAVEPVSDIAVVGALDYQAFDKEVEDFEEFCINTPSVPLYQGDFPLFEASQVHIYTHKGTWIKGNVTLYRKGANQLGLEADEQIEQGTSGGPIINDKGELVGIASNISVPPEDTLQENYKATGSVPRPHLTLPVWIYEIIFGEY